MGTDLESGRGTTPLFAAMVGGAQNAPRNDTAGAEVHKKVERAVFKEWGKTIGVECGKRPELHSCHQRADEISIIFGEESDRC